MKPVFAIASNVTTSTGMSTNAVWEAVMQGSTGIRRHEDTLLSATPFWASRMDDVTWEIIREKTAQHSTLSLFERMCVYSALDALHQCRASLNPERTVFILATTKGNIESLGGANNDTRNLLTTSAKFIGRALGIPAKTVVVSHACVSGVTALLMGLRLLQSGRYDFAIVVGADRFTRFVLSGFQSFQAIADEPCRPFDAARKGINLGEAAATIILSSNSEHGGVAKLCSGATSNDANHISGPSRTGEELSMAIGRALGQAGILPASIDAISAHGTATLYNDEMEAKAFAHAGLLHAGVHSMKGYIGHTLGAAGIAESAMVIESLRRQISIPSLGYTASGVSEPLNITVSPTPAQLNYYLKTASGFGGCNAAAVWSKV